MFFVVCFCFQYSVAQVYVGDSAIVFISKNSSINIIGDISNQFFVAKSGVIKSSLPKDSLLKTAKSRFAILHKKRVQTSKISIKKKQESQNYSIVYKPLDNSTSFNLNNNSRQNLIVPSSNGSAFGFLQKQITVNFNVYTRVELILNPEKFKISEYLRKQSLRDFPEEYEEEIHILEKLSIDGIITTNWDDTAERLFPQFTPYIGQEQLIFSSTYSVGEIYKIHGSYREPKSLVLTEDDYDNFSKKYPYLAAKLITIFIEHPVVFLGYSISDSNIQEILQSIVACLDNANIQKLQDNLIFVEWIAEEDYAIINNVKRKQGSDHEVSCNSLYNLKIRFEYLCVMKNASRIRLKSYKVIFCK